MIEDAGIADEDVERAWRLTRAAYDDPEFEGLEIDDTRAIIDISGRHVHVAFRGTATPLNAARTVSSQRVAASPSMACVRHRLSRPCDQHPS